MHCTNEEVNWLKANAKVIQKKHLEFEKNVVGHTIFAVWQQVSRDHNKSLILINYNHYIVNMYKINNVSSI